MIAILEGPDGAGKTTLARELQRRTGAPILHESGAPPPGVNVLWYYGEKLAAHRGKDVIFDRLALGERVYGPVYRGAGGDRLGDEGWLAFERLVRATGAVQVLCLPALVTCLANWERGKAAGTEMYAHSLDRVYHYYALYGDDGLVNGVYYDYEMTDLELTIARITEPRPALPPGFTGSPDARYLIVGDRGSDPRNPVDVPFFGTTGCTPYLNAALVAAGVRESDAAFVNAHTVAGTQRPFVNLAAQLPYVGRIVALGKVAARYCLDWSTWYAGQRSTTLGLRWTEVPHPQYQKRFKHSMFAEYVNMLAEAIRC